MQLLNRIWIGYEKEGKSRERRMFISGKVDYKKVFKNLNNVKAVYFAHKKDWNLVRKLLKRTKIYVEVNSLSEVPGDLLGFVTVILCVPKTDYLKIIDENRIIIVDWKERKFFENKWEGKELYEGDKAI